MGDLINIKTTTDFQVAQFFQYWWAKFHFNIILVITCMYTSAIFFSFGLLKVFAGINFKIFKITECHFNWAK